jgi:uncharacterized protein (TIGR00159 family)
MPELPWIFWRFSLGSLIDITIVALIFFWLITIVQRTRATQLIWGIVVLLVLAAVLSARSELIALNFLIERSIPALLIAIPVVFQPELRRALEQLGHTGALFNRPFGAAAREAPLINAIEEICRATSQLARQRHGALIVIERDTGLQEYAERAVALDALATRQLLITIFSPNTPLHDGAAIVRQERVVAAAVILPLTEQRLSGELGTRHRAAVGISEESDAVALVVSEESGQVSAAMDGRLMRNLNQERLRRLLLASFHLTEGRVSEGPAGLATD